MFLDICGEIERKDNYYSAKFCPSRYMLGGPTDKVPLYIIIEGLSQIGCRASAAELFDGKPCIPAQIKKLKFTNTNESITFQHDNLYLTAEAIRIHNMGVTDCKLIHPEYGCLVHAVIWTALRPEDVRKAI